LQKNALKYRRKIKLKKLVIIIMCLAMMLGSMALISCGNSEKCEHKWENHEGGIEPTCEKAGELLAKCAYCGGIKVMPMPKVDHQYLIADQWTWSDSKEAAFLLGVCKFNVKHTKVYEATVTSSVTKEPTCTEKGEKTFTATLTENGKTYTDTILVEIDAKGHSYSNGVCSVCGSNQ
jgi:hypothetical protein